MQVLYISYDGMTDPLGQSQVIPYLSFLSAKGFQITLISFEKEDNFNKSKNELEDLLRLNGINWIPLNYTKKPAILSTLWDIYKLRKLVFKLFKKFNFKIVHCRSYISSIVGLTCKRKFKNYFIFDMRGFWADERIDGKIWNLYNPIYSIIYGYFKRKEKAFLYEADHTVVLTHKAKEIITSWFEKDSFCPEISVIPCSADMALFNMDNINLLSVKNTKAELGLNETDFVLCYVGSIGTWYMLPEMLQFFKVLKNEYSSAKFLFVTKEKPELIIKEAKKIDLNVRDIIITPSERKDMPVYLSLCDASIFFIKPCFSKQASSPTKQGELMSMGIPVICNAGIGDTDLIINEVESGILINEFNEIEFKNAISKIDAATKTLKEKTREVAIKYYDLQKGAKTYLDIYSSVK